jgi:hypothetical protein
MGAMAMEYEHDHYRKQAILQWLRTAESNVYPPKIGYFWR